MASTLKHSKSDLRGHVLACAIFLIIACVECFPVLLDMQGRMYGYAGDPFEHVWYDWWYKYSYQNGFDWRHAGLIDAPVGRDLGAMPLQPAWRWTDTPLALLTNEIVTYNLMSLSTFFLSGLTMYFLARHLTKSFAASLVAGVAFTLCPYHLWHSYAHLSLAAIQWMPLYVLCLLRLREKQTVPRAVACGLAFALVALENFWYGMFMAYFTAVFAAVAIGWALWKRREAGASSAARPARQVACYLVAVAAAVAAILPFSWDAAVGALTRRELLWPAESTFAKAEAEARALSAGLDDYLRPSSDHPLWGNAFPAGDFVQERTIYVGIAVLVLSAWGFIRAVSARDADEKSRFAAILFLLGAVAGIILSLDFAVPLVHGLVPRFRVPARFAVVVSMSLSVLAAYGARSVCAGFATKRAHYASAAILALVVAVDFANLPPWHFTDVRAVPPVYNWLAGQRGDFIISELPNPRFSLYDRFFVRIHKKRLLSTYRIDQAADLERFESLNEQLRAGNSEEGALSARRYFLALYARRLAAYGVKYLVVHPRQPFPQNPVLASYANVVEFPDTLSAEEIEALDDKERPRFRRVGDFGGAVVFEVLPRPIRIVIVSDSGGALLAGEDSMTTEDGAFSFDVFLLSGRSKSVLPVLARITFHCDVPLEESASLVREGADRYILTVPLDKIEKDVKVSLVEGEKAALSDIRVTSIPAP